MKIGVSTPVDCDSVEVDGPVLKVFGKKPGSKSPSSVLLMAYHLHPGETLRANFSNGQETIYEVTL